MDGQAVKALLGKNIKLFRNLKKYSQAVLAEKAELSEIYLSNIERGIKYPHPDKLARIALALEVEIADLFKKEQIPEGSKDILYHFSTDLYQKFNITVQELIEQYTG